MSSSIKSFGGMPDVAKETLIIINNTFEIEKKLLIHGDDGNAMRNVSKIKEVLEAKGLSYEDPQGQSFSETRTDLEASIAGQSTENLVVVEVIKPIIRLGTNEHSIVVQKGIVVVEGKEKE